MVNTCSFIFIVLVKFSIEESRCVQVFVKCRDLGARSTPKRTVSIKHTGIKNSQRSLLNIQYDPRFVAANCLTFCTYNREPRVICFMIGALIGVIQ